MKTNYFKVLLTIFLLATANISCGTKEGGDSAIDLGTKNLSLGTKSDLPACSTDNETQFAYVKDETSFYECVSSEWVKVQVGEQAEPFKVVKKYEYLQLNYAEAINLSDTGSLDVRIGQIEVTEFPNSVLQVTVSGNYKDTDTNGDTFYQDFSYTYMLADGEQYHEHRMSGYSNVLLHTYVDLVTFRFGAVLDSDDNFTSDSLFNFEILEK